MFTPGYQYGTSFTVKTSRRKSPADAEDATFALLSKPSAFLGADCSRCLERPFRVWGGSWRTSIFASTTLQYVHSSRSEKCDRRQGYGRLHHH